MAPSSRLNPDLLHLPQVTLCAVTSVNVPATVRALEACLGQMTFADCILLTDTTVRLSHPQIRIVPIGRLSSSAAYSEFLLSRLVDHIGTSHCLVVQWDGHVLDASRWRAEFLDWDYIGASWPQFDDGHDIGNGGFSLRSRRLMEACRAPEFRQEHPEDIAIGRTNRIWLEEQGIRFAPCELADCFAAERAGNVETSFGYHGVWHMPQSLGVDIFWRIYRELDDRNTVWVDFGTIIKKVLSAPRGTVRALQVLLHRAISFF